MLLTLLTAAATGALSTLHCWGMCGGIVSALSMGVPDALRARRGALLWISTAYNLGRIASYAVLGTLVGVLAAQGTRLGAGSGAYRGLQALGCATLVIAGLRLAGWLPQSGPLEVLGLRLWRVMGRLGRRLLPLERWHRGFAAGALWGLMPCGLVYAMLPVGAGTGSVAGSALTMTAFGLGTLPGMLFAGYLAGRLGHIARRTSVRRYAGIALIVLASGWFAMQWLGGSTMNDHHHHHGTMG